MKKYTIILLMILLAFMKTHEMYAQTFHVFIFANTNDPKIGKSCDVDKEKILVNVKTAARVLNYKVSTHIFTGKDFNKDNLRNALNNFSCSENDVVFFYFTGHGGRSQEDQEIWPQMNFNKSGQNVDEYYVPLNIVDKMFDEHGPKFRLVMADCCNNYANITPKVDMRGQTVVDNENHTNEVFAKLFKDVKGNVLISSSKQGEYSYSDTEKGGWFTANYIEALTKAMNKEVNTSWESLLSYAKNATLAETQNNPSCPNPQTPQYEINIETKVNPNPTPIHNNYIDDIISLLNNNVEDDTKLKNVKSIINKYFQENAIVQTIAKNGITILDTENIKKYLYRLSFSDNIINIVELEKEKENGKIYLLKVHEIRSNN